MRLRLFFALLVGVTLMQYGCKKSSPGYTYMFTNPINQPVNIVVYQNQADYDNVTNPFITAVVPPNGNYAIKSYHFSQNVTYYIDYYSNDYSYSNWVNRTSNTSAFAPTFVPSAIDNNFELTAFPDYARVLCLAGNKARTFWKAIGGSVYVNSSVSTPTSWTGLTATQQYFVLEFQKNMSAIMHFNDVNGDRVDLTQNIQTDSLGDPVGTSTGNISLHEGANYTANIFYTLTAPSGTPGATVKDTITATFYHTTVPFYKGTLTLVRDTTMH